MQLWLKCEERIIKGICNYCVLIEYVKIVAYGEASKYFLVKKMTLVRTKFTDWDVLIKFGIRV